MCVYSLGQVHLPLSVDVFMYMSADIAAVPCTCEALWHMQVFPLPSQTPFYIRLWYSVVQTVAKQPELQVVLMTAVTGCIPCILWVLQENNACKDVVIRMSDEQTTAPWIHASQCPHDNSNRRRLALLPISKLCMLHAKQ